MRKTIAAAAMAASVAAGGLAGAVLGTPGTAAAQAAASQAVGWVQDALSGLVDDGTITQDQADAVEEALDEARPDRGFGHHGPHGHHGLHGPHVGLAAAAEAIGTTEEELRDAVAGGRTVADVAAEQGVEVAAVVDAVVAAHAERLDEAVAAGALTREQADELLAEAEERATAFVEGELPPFRGGPHGGWRPGGAGPGGGDAGDGDAGGDGTS